MSSRRSNGPRFVKQVTKPEVQYPTKLTGTCTCDTCPVHPYKASAPKEKSKTKSSAITILISSAWDEDDGICYKVKGNTLFRRFSDDYHERKRLARGEVTFYIGSSEVPWDFAGTFASILSMQKKTQSPFGDDVQSPSQYIIEAYRM